MMYRVTWSTKRKGEKIIHYANFRSYVVNETESASEESNKESGNIDIRARAPNPSEIIAVARMLGCRVSREKGWITTDNDDAYYRLVVYAVVRQILKTPARIDMLKSLILSEDFGTDAWWWANTFMNRYRGEGMKKGIGIRSLYRPAKAFKLVYNLVEK